MKLVNNLNIRVFCKQEENREKIKEGIEKILGFDKDELKSEKIEIKKTQAKGFEDEIRIYEVFLENKRHLNKVLKKLNEELTTQDKKRIQTQENRLDNNLDFYIRLSKPLILENTFELTDSGDCYHIKINIASFPKNKETAKKKIQEIFS